MTHLIEHWHRPAHVAALQTTNRLLDSKHPFNIHPQQINDDAISILVDSFKLPHAPYFLQQVHGHNVVEYTSRSQLLNSRQMSQSADACFTRIPGVICSVMTADCLPILLTDQMGSFVAAVHCGWRGLYANIIAETVNAINSHNEIIAWLGPCIQAAQYEVDEEFKNHYLKQHPNVGHAFSPLIKGKCQADLYQLASIQLHKLDIKNLTQSNQCTFLNADYYSWRENQTAARMASMAWLTTDSIPA